MTYTSIERVRTALEHREPDRVPLDLGGTMVSAINVHALSNLRRYLGLSDKVAVWEKVTQIGVMDDDLIERLGVDIKNVGPRPPENPGPAKDLGVEVGYAALTDEFGIGWHMPLPGGHYYDLYRHPLSHVESVAEIENYAWPDPLDPGRFEGLKQRADRIAGEEKKAYVLERMSAGMWENAIWMMGYEKFFCDMILNPKLIQAIMEKFLEIKMIFWGKALETVGENVLIVPDADDLGAQTSLLVSLELYKKLIWPYHRRLIEFIKKKAASKVYVFFHCDGAIREAIPLLIEAGVDIINPLQVHCRGMEDTRALKKEFGRDLTFWGGSCDTQFILPFGSVDQVREETKRRIADLAPGGGFIFAPIHVIQAEVPPENIMAWWETLQTFGVY